MRPALAWTASTWDSAAGPGSMTSAGSSPTIQVFVPSSVNGPGFGATTGTMRTRSGMPE